MNKQNVTFPIGNIAVIDKIASQTDFFKFVFGNLAGRARDFIPLIKLLIWNKLDESYSIDRLGYIQNKEKDNKHIPVT